MSLIPAVSHSVHTNVRHLSGWMFEFFGVRILGPRQAGVLFAARRQQSQAQDSTHRGDSQASVGAHVTSTRKCNKAASRKGGSHRRAQLMNRAVHAWTIRATAPMLQERDKRIKRRAMT